MKTSHLDGPLWNFFRYAKHNITKVFFEWGSRLIVRRITQMTGMRVVTGPFEGMVVANEHIYGAPVAKLLGTYEKELHQYVTRILENEPCTVLDVGGAEGYYAIGMALRERVEKVIVWESLEAGRALIEHLARTNCVLDKVMIQGECQESSLYEAVVSRPVGALIMDVEGAELELLSTRVCAALRGWSFIVEGHDFLRSGCTQELISRFESTHQIFTVQSRKRLVEDFPLKLNMAGTLKVWLMNEGRPGGMCWVIGSPEQKVIANAPTRLAPG